MGYEEYDNDEIDDREDYLSLREQEECDRLDYAREIEDPDRAAEIRAGA